MPTLNFDLDYFEHYKTKRLTGLLGRGAEVIPLKLWVHTGKFHAHDGILTGYSAQEVESIIGWWGPKEKAIDALIKVGFIEPVENGYLVHDWSEHSGHLAVFKTRAKSAASKRWQAMLNDDPSNAKPQPKQCLSRNQAMLKSQSSNAHAVHALHANRESGAGKDILSQTNDNDMVNYNHIVIDKDNNNNNPTLAPLSPVLPNKNNGNSNGKSDAIKGSQFPRADIEKIIDTYLEAKQMVLAGELARQAYIKLHFYEAKDLLAITGGDVSLACLAITDLAPQYDKDEQSQGWTLKYVAKDFLGWDKSRRRYESKKLQRR